MNLPSADGEFNLTPDMIESLRVKYPRTDIDRELAKIHLWLHRNPSRRWSRMLSGIEKWLSKVETRQRERGAKLHVVTNDWWRTDAGTIAHGEKIGIQARPGGRYGDL